MSGIAFHPLANLFPLIEGDDFLTFAEDIRVNGVRDEIVLLDGQNLDGRNRYRALEWLVETGEVLGQGWGHRAGEPLDAEHLDPDNAWFRKFNRNVDGDPLAWVISKNLKRRHMDESQRAMVAAKIAGLSVGRPAKEFEPAPDHIPPSGGISEQATDKIRPIGRISEHDAAALLNVGERSVRRARAVLRDGAPELQHAVEQGQIAVSAAEKIARLPEQEQPAAVAKALPGGARALMGSRHEPDDSLDYFPTPPWATRALMEHVFPQLGIAPTDLHSATDTACGEGHITGVLQEYFPAVTGSDIFDYSVDGRSPPAWAGQQDYLAPDAIADEDWIITNPPFDEKAELFTLRAIEQARIGVAIFARVQWLDTIGRYERIFSQCPPTLMAFFAERVPLVKGRWDPEASTATAYMWLLWVKDAPRLPPMWIPPGCRKQLSRSDDVARFTAHPVISFVRPDESFLTKWTRVINPPRPDDQPAIAPLDGACCERDEWPLGAVVPLPDDFRLGSPAPVAAPTPAVIDLSIPSFLKRDANNTSPAMRAAS